MVSNALMQIVRLNEFAAQAVSLEERRSSRLTVSKCDALGFLRWLSGVFDPRSASRHSTAITPDSHELIEFYSASWIDTDGLDVHGGSANPIAC